MFDSTTVPTDGHAALARDLSFTRIEGDTLHLWQPVRTGNYAADCRQGRAYGQEVVARLQVDRGGPLLGHVCEAIGAQGIWEGVEVGFWAAISEAATDGP